MEELLRFGDSLSCLPRSQPLLLPLHPPASPWRKALHPLGSTCLHTQLGPQLAREFRGTLYPDNSCSQSGHQFSQLSSS